MCDEIFEPEIAPAELQKDTVYILNEHGRLEEVEVPDDVEHT